MSIKVKFVFFAIAIAALFTIAFGTYFVFLSPVESMRLEMEYFRNLSRSTQLLRVESNRLLSEVFLSQAPAFKKAVRQYEESFESMAKIKVLSSVSPALAEAVKNVSGNASLSSGGLESLTGVVDDLSKLLPGIVDDSMNFSAVDMFGSSYGAGDELAGRMRSLAKLVRGLNVTLARISIGIDENEAQVNAEIEKIRRKSLVIVFFIIAMIIGIALGLSFLLANGIIASLRTIDAGVEKIGRGDVSFRFRSKKKDEIGKLCVNFDAMLDSLNEVLMRMQFASNQNVLLKESLDGAVSEATSSTSEISASSQSIGRQMKRMEGMIGDSTRNSQDIFATISGFNDRLSEQKRHIDVSVSSVTQMLSSIENIGRITEWDKTASEDLVSESERGRDVFQKSFERVAEIGNSVESIQEMATVISAIASQTNILALNAAIEAAHAGEFGKGFAVVADEIGKLAAASAENSVEITKTILEVVEKIRQADETRAATIDAFEAINAKIRVVSNSINEIYSNVNETQLGGRLILEAMEKLKLGSTEGTREFSGIKAAAKDIETSNSELERISHEVASSIDEISIGLGDILRAVENISTQSGKIGEIGKDIDGAVRTFKTESLGSTGDYPLFSETNHTGAWNEKASRVR